MSTYINKATIQKPAIWNELKLKKDSKDRWVTSDSTPSFVVEYLSNVRYPSRAYPNSYFVALLTQKFAKFLTASDANLAVKLNVAIA